MCGGKQGLASRASKGGDRGDRKGPLSRGRTMTARFRKESMQVGVVRESSDRCADARQLARHDTHGLMSGALAIHFEALVLNKTSLAQLRLTERTLRKSQRVTNALASVSRTSRIRPNSGNLSYCSSTKQSGGRGE